MSGSRNDLWGFRVWIDYLTVKSGFSPGMDRDVIHASWRESWWRIDASLISEDVGNNTEAVGGRPAVAAKDVREDCRNNGKDHDDN